jgi:hypothetical protein
MEWYNQFVPELHRNAGTLEIGVSKSKVREDAGIVSS